MWRLRLFFERVGWKPFAVGAAVLVALVAAAVAFAVLRGGDDKSATQTENAPPEESTNLYYLQAVAPETRVRGCSMWIRFIWKPDYHAEQYIDAPALITASGTGIQGTYQKRFGEKGVSIELGPVSLLVNNAGYGHHRPFLRWDVEDMERVMRVNYLGSLYFTKALLPGMVERGEGFVVFVASVAGHIASPDESAYAASKFAQVALAESLSVEVEDRGVHVLTVCPGVIRTPFFDAEALARMPGTARRSMVEPAALVDAILDALAHGRHRLTYPRRFALAYPIRDLFPRFFRWGVKRAALPPD